MPTTSDKIAKCDIYLKRRQCTDGHEIVNGQPHGFKWRDRYVVEAVFDEKDDALTLIDLLLKAGGVKR